MIGSNERKPVYEVVGDIYVLLKITLMVVFFTFIVLVLQVQRDAPEPVIQGEIACLK